MAGAAFDHIYTSVASTTPGVAGYLRGGEFCAIELQYIGDHMFMLLSHAGDIDVY